MLQTNVVEKIKTQFYIEVDCSKIQVVCEIKWKNMVEPDRPQMTCFACWLIKGTDAH